MRVVVIGAGAIGGAMASQLHEAELEVLLVARGANYDVIAKDGLTVVTPDRVTVSKLDVVNGVRSLRLRDDDVVLLCTKSQDTQSVIEELSGIAASTLPVFCAQNGVSNERVVGENFENTFGICVMSPGSHLEPGRVEVFASPTIGVLDVGRWPRGDDVLAEEVSRLLRDAGYASMATGEIETLKWGKLLANVLNALEVLCGSGESNDVITEWIHDEAVACASAVGIDVSRAEALTNERSALLTYHSIAGARRVGSSSWQSVLRGTGTIETDYLNGEIVALGVQYGVDTPVNELLRTRANEMVRRRDPPGSVDIAKLHAALGR